MTAVVGMLGRVNWHRRPPLNASRAHRAQLRVMPGNLACARVLPVIDRRSLGSLRSVRGRRLCLQQRLHRQQDADPAAVRRVAPAPSSWPTCVLRTSRARVRSCAECAQTRCNGVRSRRTVRSCARAGGCVLCVPFPTSRVFHTCPIVARRAHSWRRGRQRCCEPLVFSRVRAGEVWSKWRCAHACFHV